MAEKERVCADTWWKPKIFILRNCANLVIKKRIVYFRAWGTIDFEGAHGCPFQGTRWTNFSSSVQMKRTIKKRTKHKTQLMNWSVMVKYVSWHRCAEKKHSTVGCPEKSHATQNPNEADIPWSSNFQESLKLRFNEGEKHLPSGNQTWLAGRSLIYRCCLLAINLHK